jgi:hypothetical protein
MYLQDFMNMKFADANGDGVIDSLDAEVVLANCGMQHGNYNTTSENLLGYGDYIIGLYPSTNWTNSLQWYDVPLEIDCGPTDSLYGASITIDIDDTFLDSVYVTFPTWMSNGGNDLLTMYKYLPSKHQIIIAECRKDHKQVIGIGTVAVIHLRYICPSMGCPSSLSINRTSKLISDGMYAGQRNLQRVLRTSIDAPISVTVDPESTGPQLSNQINLQLYPNPAKDKLFLNWENATMKNIEVIDLLGRTLIHVPCNYNPLMMTPVGPPTVDVSKLPAGEYILKATTTEGVATKMFEVR